MDILIPEEDWDELPEEEKETLDDPILITGTARSGTSLTAAIIASCGAWTGPTIPASMDMPTGFVENAAMRQTILKPLMNYLGADILGQASLLDPENIYPDPFDDSEMAFLSFLRDTFLSTAYLQGLREETAWLYKDARLASIHPYMEEIFPASKWVVVRRSIDDIVASCEKTSFMGMRGDIDWRKWAEINNRNLDHLCKNAKNPVTEICYEDLVSFDLGDIQEFVEWEEGLEWDEYEIEGLIL